MKYTVLLLCLGAAPAAAADYFLFTSFRGNGETGTYLALSEDGRRWTPLNDNRPWIKPEHPGMLMRDPFLARGSDGTWHLLWTWGWNRKEMGGQLKIGYASSKDLIAWSPQREIRVLDNEPAARNAWAPEAVWDQTAREWIVFWSTTIPGRFPETKATGDNSYNHRIYMMTTRDWKSFSAPRVWFDPGFNCIDATVLRNGERWVMVFKDERVRPEKKNLRFAFADSPAGPWRDVSEAFTPAWVEGPSAVKIGPDWWIYFDHYRAPRHYGAVKTRDWKIFENITSQLSFPPDHRHGTVVRISETEARRMRSIVR
jgi:hypothetical protein